MAVLRNRDERLQSLKDLVARLAHDFNNSLVPLTGYVTLLKEELKPETPSTQFVAKMDACVQRTGGLIDALLEATHPERRYSPRLVDLTALVRRVAEAWIAALPSAGHVSIETNSTAGSLWLDEPLWSKAIEHLLSNAELAVDHHGTIKLSLQKRDLTSSQAADLSFTDTSVFELVCEDAGCGMPEDVLKRACDPLFTAWSGSSATGLGLTLAHSVARLHGGQLALESTEGIGTRVTIWLPATGA